MTRLRLPLLFILALTLACGDDNGPPLGDARGESAPGGTIHGVVTTTVGGAPIMGATVQTVPTTLEATTLNTGDFDLAPIAPGDYVVEATAPGFEKGVSTSVTVEAGQIATIQIHLAAAITYRSTCESCHLRLDRIEASLKADPLPEPPGGGSAGEG